MRKPMAKKLKYMSAAGCWIRLGMIGGSENSTKPRLFMPISTRSRRTRMTNSDLRKILAFMAAARARRLSTGPHASIERWRRHEVSS